MNGRKTRVSLRIFLGIFVLVSTFFTSALSGSEEPIPNYTYRIVNYYPHDSGAFTQGLVYEDGFLYEGTGRWGQSSLRKVELETGKILQSYGLSYRFFGEGITIYNDKIIQLTWKSGTGFVYDKESFELLQRFRYPYEGWGITHDGERLIVSDGTSTLHFLDPGTFEERGSIEVHAGRDPVTNLNELEFIGGLIYANVWQTDLIAEISPETGEVVGWIDLSGIMEADGVDVLNGIAYDREEGRLFVTGKLWPKLFEIEIVSL